MAADCLVCKTCLSIPLLNISKLEKCLNSEAMKRLYLDDQIGSQLCKAGFKMLSRGL